MIPLTALVLSFEALDPQRQSSNPVANTFEHASTIGWLYLAVAISVVVLLIAAHVDLAKLARYRRRRRKLPESTPRVDPTRCRRPAITRTPPDEEPLLPFPPAAGMLLAVVAALYLPVLFSHYGRVHTETLLWTWFACACSFLVFLHAEIVRPPQFRGRPGDEDATPQPIGPRSQKAPRRRLSKRVSERVAGERYVVLGACLVAIVAVAVLAPYLATPADGFWDLPLLRTGGVEVRFAIAAFLGFAGMLLATPVIDRVAERRARRSPRRAA